MGAQPVHEQPLMSRPASINTTPVINPNALFRRGGAVNHVPCRRHAVAVRGERNGSHVQPRWGVVGFARAQNRLQAKVR